MSNTWNQSKSKVLLESSVCPNLPPRLQNALVHYKNIDNASPSPTTSIDVINRAITGRKYLIPNIAPQWYRAVRERQLNPDMCKENECEDQTCTGQRKIVCAKQFKRISPQFLALLQKHEDKLWTKQQIRTILLQRLSEIKWKQSLCPYDNHKEHTSCYEKNVVERKVIAQRPRSELKVVEGTTQLHGNHNSGIHASKKVINKQYHAGSEVMVNLQPTSTTIIFSSARTYSLRKSAEQIEACESEAIRAEDTGDNNSTTHTESTDLVSSVSLIHARTNKSVSSIYSGTNQKRKQSKDSAVSSLQDVVSANKKVQYKLEETTKKFAKWRRFLHACQRSLSKKAKPIKLNNRRKVVESQSENELPSVKKLKKKTQLLHEQNDTNNKLHKVAKVSNFSLELRRSMSENLQRITNFDSKSRIAESFTESVTFENRANLEIEHSEMWLPRPKSGKDDYQSYRCGQNAKTKYSDNCSNNVYYDECLYDECASGYNDQNQNQCNYGNERLCNYDCDEDYQTNQCNYVNQTLCNYDCDEDYQTNQCNYVNERLCNYDCDEEYQKTQCNYVNGRLCNYDCDEKYQKNQCNYVNEKLRNCDEKYQKNQCNDVNERLRNCDEKYQKNQCNDVNEKLRNCDEKYQKNQCNDVNEKLRNCDEKYKKNKCNDVNEKLRNCDEKHKKNKCNDVNDSDLEYECSCDEKYQKNPCNYVNERLCNCDCDEKYQKNPCNYVNERLCNCDCDEKYQKNPCNYVNEKLCSCDCDENYQKNPCNYVDERLCNCDCDEKYLKNLCNYISYNDLDYECTCDDTCPCKWFLDEPILKPCEPSVEIKQDIVEDSTPIEEPKVLEKPKKKRFQPCRIKYRSFDPHSHGYDLLYPCGDELRRIGRNAKHKRRNRAARAGVILEPEEYDYNWVEKINLKKDQKSEKEEVEQDTDEFRDKIENVVFEIQTKTQQSDCPDKCEGICRCSKYANDSDADSRCQEIEPATRKTQQSDCPGKCKGICRCSKYANDSDADSRCQEIEPATRKTQQSDCPGKCKGICRCSKYANDSDADSRCQEIEPATRKTQQSDCPGKCEGICKCNKSAYDSDAQSKCQEFEATTRTIKLENYADADTTKTQESDCPGKCEGICKCSDSAPQVPEKTEKPDCLIVYAKPCYIPHLDILPRREERMNHDPFSYYKHKYDETRRLGGRKSTKSRHEMRMGVKDFFKSLCSCKKAKPSMSRDSEERVEKVIRTEKYNSDDELYGNNAGEKIVFDPRPQEEPPHLKRTQKFDLSTTQQIKEIEEVTPFKTESNDAKKDKALMKDIMRDIDSGEPKKAKLATIFSNKKRYTDSLSDAKVEKTEKVDKLKDIEEMKVREHISNEPITELKEAEPPFASKWKSICTSTDPKYTPSERKSISGEQALKICINRPLDRKSTCACNKRICPFSQFICDGNKRCPCAAARKMQSCSNQNNTDEKCRTQDYARSAPKGNQAACVCGKTRRTFNEEETDCRNETRSQDCCRGLSRENQICSGARQRELPNETPRAQSQICTCDNDSCSKKRHLSCNSRTRNDFSSNKKTCTCPSLRKGRSSKQEDLDLQNETRSKDCARGASKENKRDSSEEQPKMRTCDDDSCAKKRHLSRGRTERDSSEEQAKVRTCDDDSCGKKKHLSRERTETQLQSRPKQNSNCRTRDDFSSKKKTCTCPSLRKGRSSKQENLDLRNEIRSKDCARGASKEKKRDSSEEQAQIRTCDDDSCSKKKHLSRERKEPQLQSHAQQNSNSKKKCTCPSVKKVCPSKQDEIDLRNENRCKDYSREASKEKKEQPQMRTCDDDSCCKKKHLCREETDPQLQSRPQQNSNSCTRDDFSSNRKTCTCSSVRKGRSLKQGETGLRNESEEQAQMRTCDDESCGKKRLLSRDRKERDSSEEQVQMRTCDDNSCGKKRHLIRDSSEEQAQIRTCDDNSCCKKRPLSRDSSEEQAQMRTCDDVSCCKKRHLSREKAEPQLQSCPDDYSSNKKTCTCASVRKGRPSKQEETDLRNETRSKDCARGASKEKKIGSGQKKRTGKKDFSRGRSKEKKRASSVEQTEYINQVPRAEQAQTCTYDYNLCCKRRCLRRESTEPQQQSRCNSQTKENLMKDSCACCEDNNIRNKNQLCITKDIPQPSSSMLLLNTCDTNKSGTSVISKEGKDRKAKSSKHRKKSSTSIKSKEGKDRKSKTLKKSQTKDAANKPETSAKSQECKDHKEKTIRQSLNKSVANKPGTSTKSKKIKEPNVKTTKTTQKSKTHHGAVKQGLSAKSNEASSSCNDGTCNYKLPVTRTSIGTRMGRLNTNATQKEDKKPIDKKNKDPHKRSFSTKDKQKTSKENQADNKPGTSARCKGRGKQKETRGSKDKQELRAAQNTKPNNDEDTDQSCYKCCGSKKEDQTDQIDMRHETRSKDYDRGASNEKKSDPSEEQAQMRTCDNDSCAKKGHLSRERTEGEAGQQSDLEFDKKWNQETGKSLDEQSGQESYEQSKKQSVQQASKQSDNSSKQSGKKTSCLDPKEDDDFIDDCYKACFRPCFRPCGNNKNKDKTDQTSGEDEYYKKEIPSTSKISDHDSDQNNHSDYRDSFKETTDAETKTDKSVKHKKCLCDSGNWQGVTKNYPLSYQHKAKQQEKLEKERNDHIRESAKWGEPLRSARSGSRSHSRSQSQSQSQSRSRNRNRSSCKCHNSEHPSEQEQQKEARRKSRERERERQQNKGLKSPLSGWVEGSKSTCKNKSTNEGNEWEEESQENPTSKHKPGASDQQSGHQRDLEDQEDQSRIDEENQSCFNSCGKKRKRKDQADHTDQAYQADKDQQNAQEESDREICFCERKSHSEAQPSKAKSSECDQSTCEYTDNEQNQEYLRFQYRLGKAKKKQDDDC